MAARRLLLLAAALATAQIPVAASSEAPFAKPPVTDAELDAARGGFPLPGGLNLNFAVQTETRLNGELLLRSVLLVGAEPPTLSVYVGNSATTVRADAGSGASMLPSAGGSPNFLVNILTKSTPLGEVSDGLEKIDLGAGAPVAAAGGQVRVDRIGGFSQVVLSNEQMDVRHLMGQAFGSIVANRADDVRIDTATVINIDLADVPSLALGSILSRIDAVVTESTYRYGR